MNNVNSFTVADIMNNKHMGLDLSPSLEQMDNLIIMVPHPTVEDMSFKLHLCPFDFTVDGAEIICGDHTYEWHSFSIALAYEKANTKTTVQWDMEDIENGFLA